MIFKKTRFYIFQHIPKTAGTSFRQYILQVFGPKRVLLIYPEDPYCRYSNVIAKPEKQLKQYDAFFGHMHFGLHRYLPGRARYFTFLRDPLDRVVSNYQHHRTRPGAPFHEHIKARNMGLEAFVCSGLTVETDNLMTRAISGIARELPYGQCDERLLEVAIRNLRDHYEEVLFVEDMQVSLARLKKSLPRSARSRMRKESMPLLNANAQSSEEQALSTAMRDLLHEKNSLDVRLYEFACNLFAGRGPPDSGQDR